MKINILPPAIFNLLSAGEVVENPAAIVKECVENSIDAKATRIEIAITRGGLDMISISDNGSGVATVEVEKVFLPHATSKIAKAKDLDKIATLGFRGEAMSSIAAVSIVDFTTCTDDKVATHLHLEGGKITTRKSVARTRGTTVTISNLFYNTPARAKFMRTPAAEKNAVTKIVQGFILANPSIALRYKIDDEIIYDYNGKSLKDAIKAIYGVVPLLSLHYKPSPSLFVSGYAASPEFAKKNRTFQTVIVNGRVIDDEIISDAVNSVFSNYMIVGNFPFFVINLKIDFSSVDVNVHPRKAQIKFSDPVIISDSVRHAVSAAIDIYLQNKHSINFAMRKDDELLGRLSFFQNNDDTKTEVKSVTNIINKFNPENISAFPKDNSTEQQIIDTKIVQKFDIMGTIFNTYILINDGSNLHIIDQHAAHERILYDKLSAQIDSQKISQQKLLEPIILILSPEEMTKMESCEKILNQCGISCEPFGTNCFRITAVPVVVSTHGIDSLVDGLLSDIKNLALEKLSKLLRDKIIKQCCIAAVKGGQSLDMVEIKNLINTVMSTTTLTCPHGRPIFISFTQSQIEKMIARK